MRHCKTRPSSRPLECTTPQSVGSSMRMRWPRPLPGMRDRKTRPSLILAVHALQVWAPALGAPSARQAGGAAVPAYPT